MNEFELDADLAAANPVSEETVSSAVPPMVGEAMLREITAVERSSRPRLFLQRLGESVTGGLGPARVGFVAVVAALLVVVGVTAASIRSGQTAVEPALESATDTRPVLEVADGDDPVGTSEPIPESDRATRSSAPFATVDDDLAAEQDEDATVETDQNTEGEPAEPPVPVVESDSVAGDFDRDRDLISLHVEYATDLDDVHAIVASQVVTDSLGIVPWVIASTAETGRDGSPSAFVQVMDATWGKDRWRNADANRGDVVASTANRWEATLNGGGDVWVAEGGRPDLTAAVVRELLLRKADTDTFGRVHVIQHSNDSEAETSDANLAYLQANTDYRRIADGNQANTTADLDTDSAGWASTARNSQWGPAWDVAFGQLDPDDRLDFADTVAVLYIVGVGTDQIATPDDFADRFFE